MLKLCIALYNNLFTELHMLTFAYCNACHFFNLTTKKIYLSVNIESPNKFCSVTLVTLLYLYHYIAS